jgi:sugar phosphate isomerase/epimerase
MYFPRIGTTSYILPADFLPNIRYLSGIVQDIELVLFDLDLGPNNLPGPAIVAEMADRAQAEHLSYTVHFPEDLWIGNGRLEDRPSWIKARKVVDFMRGLNPLAYVLHLDGREVRSGAPVEALRRWQDQAVLALETLAGWVGDASLLAVENLESYPPDFIQPVVERVPVSRCVDVGHLWFDGHDPVPYLQQALPRSRVIHLHGIDGRDHQSLARVPAEDLKAVMDLLIQSGYAGVLTLEIFGMEDFWSSMEALSPYLPQ